jgi:hypothetical protein
MVAKSSIPEEVKERWLEAEYKLSAIKDKLASKQDFANLLSAYEKSISETAAAMKALGVWDKCARCGKSSSGSCCAPEVASWYDVETLMINILMGCELPSDPFYSGHCLFLGEKGCVLKARHYFCVHFLCPKIQDLLGQHNKNILMKTVGNEILWGSKVLSYIVSVGRSLIPHSVAG